jgi:prevent-host-death family protein
VILLDSNVAIDYLRDRPEAVDVVETVAANVAWMGASEIVRFEVLAGIRPSEVEGVEAFFAQLGWVPVDESISRRAAALARNHRSAFAGIEDADYLIAATVLELDARLLTANVRHFPMLDSSRLTDAVGNGSVRSDDHGKVTMVMKTISASRFKAQCLTLLDVVASTGEAILVTKRGKPVARVIPAEQPPSLVGSVEILVPEDEFLAPIDVSWDASS